MRNYAIALYMLEKGVQCIPLNENKKPLLGFASVTITEDFINNHHQEYMTAAALGALTRGIWCIDLDKHGGFVTGYRSMTEIDYYSELDYNAMRTWVQSTPSGGMHIIFKKQNGIDYSQKISYMRNVDVKAHDNNYFVLGGSVTRRGMYLSNGQPPVSYQGDFEERIFNWEGSTFDGQILERHSMRKALPNVDFSFLYPVGKHGRGKAAYERIIHGESIERNNDLFLAASYAKHCKVDIEPLTVLIDSVKERDQFTEKEFWKTVDSASGL